ncbi:MAG: hypothetical protein D3903_14020, partial [Candidatus Electrothrix sp. GM3_4]|nr:hypothetical protein [Candidatus Electrothrix sp. GM3_4]
TVTLTNDSAEDMTIDFGYNSPCTGRMGDYVWNDVNRNGIQDADESGIENVTVNLKDSQNTVLATVTTAANGFYEFNGFCANEYKIEVNVSTLPAGFVSSPTLEGNDPTVDSNENSTTVMLNDDYTEDMTIDFGYNSPCTGRMGDYVWNDVNRNGIQDAGESGIENVTVNLKDSQNTVLATVTTVVNGSYEFNGLCANTYKVEVDESTLPPNMVSSPTLEGNDPTVDSNINSTTVTLTNDSAEDMTIDFGYNSPCTGRIGDYVWNDINRNGLQDAEEPGIAGVIVQLKDSDSTPIIEVTTDAYGYYEFNGFCANTYKIEVNESTLPPNMVSSPTDQGGDPTIDSNANGTLVTLETDNGVNITIDFGYNSFCIGRIGDTVWFDENRNGIQDAGEAGIAGISINLKDAQNVTIATVITDVSGYYEFSSLCANDYKVEVDTSTLLADYVASPTLQGTDSTVDSNENGTVVKLINDFAEDMTIDFGYNSPCSGYIGDYVWLDTNKDGLQDILDSGISHVSVILRDNQNTEIATTMTDSNGHYAFTGLCANEYRVEIDPYSLPANVVPTNSMVGSDITRDSNGSPADVSLAGDYDSDITIDFGYIEELVPGDNCKECDGKVTQMIMQYNGTTAAMVEVKQKKGAVVFSSMVQPGGHFNFSGVDKKGTLGTEITISVNGSQNTKIHTSCSVEVGPGLIAGDFEVIEAYSRNNGLMCPVDSVDPPPTGGDCSPCDGKISRMTLEYKGTEAAQVVITQKKGEVVFSATVQPGEQFSIVGTDKGTLGTEITISVNGGTNAKVHTSCSVPVGPGLIAGDFKVIEAHSLKGGLMCPVGISDPNNSYSDDSYKSDKGSSKKGFSKKGSSKKGSGKGGKN